MKTITKLSTFCALLLLVATHSYAQTDTIDAPKPAKNYLKIGVNYLSNNVFLGRVDSVTTPALSPSIKFAVKNGLYLSGSMDIITNRPTHKLDGGNIELGYDYISDSNLDWGASFAKLFFNSTSTQVDASLTGEFNAYIDYDIEEIITPSLSATYQLVKSGTPDFLISPSLSHDFLIESIFGDRDKVLISPEAMLNAGSQNFYSEYLITKGKIKRKQVSAAYDAYNSQLGKFVLLDYELTAPIVYIAGKLSLSVIPTVAFAQNNLPASTAAEKLITTAIEKTQPFKTSVFYVDAGVSYKF